MGRFARLSLLVALASSMLVPQAFAAGGQASPEETRAERIILKKINVYRVDRGLAPLVRHEFMSKEARKHSNYMANQGKLSHDGFSSRKSRIASNDAGIDPAKICENTASAQGYDNPGPVAKKVVRAWKKSGSKRRCLLDVDFATHSAGVGVEHRGDSWYATFIAANDSTP